MKGDILIVQNKAPHVGDVACFYLPFSGYSCERLIAERWENNTHQFATKGDNNPISDASSTVGNEFGWITESQIFGIVVFTIHHIGWFTVQFHGFLFLGFIFGIIAILLFDMYRTSKKKS